MICQYVKEKKKRITQIGRKKSDKVEKKFPPEKYETNFITCNYIYLAIHHNSFGLSLDIRLIGYLKVK